MRLWDLPLSRAVLAIAQGISPFRHYIALSNIHHNRSKSFGYGTTGRAFNSFARCGCRDEVVKRHWQPCRLKNVRDTPRKLSHDCHGQPKLDYKFSFVNIVLLSGFVVRSIRESCLCRSSTSRERVWPKNFTNQARTLRQRAIWNSCAVVAYGIGCGKLSRLGSEHEEKKKLSWARQKKRVYNGTVRTSQQRTIKSRSPV